MYNLMSITINDDDKLQHVIWHFYNGYIDVMLPIIVSVNTKCEGNV
jgi:hypothetical protein